VARTASALFADQLIDIAAGNDGPGNGCRNRCERNGDEHERQTEAEPPDQGD
jgi:hypothetical protein